MERFWPAILTRELSHGGPPTRIRVQVQILLGRPFVAVFAEQEKFHLDGNVISRLKDGFQFAVHPFAVGALRICKHDQTDWCVFWTKTPSPLQWGRPNQRIGGRRV